MNTQNIPVLDRAIARAHRIDGDAPQTTTVIRCLAEELDQFEEGVRRVSGMSLFLSCFGFVFGVGALIAVVLK